MIIFIKFTRAGFVQVMKNLESHGKSKFQNPGLENLEN